MALLKARSRRSAASSAPEAGIVASEGSAPARTPGGPVTEAGRGVRATWRYTVSSIVFFSVVLIAMSTLFMLSGGEYGLQLPDVAVIVLSTIACAALVRFCWFFRPGLGAGPPPRIFTLWLLLPAAALYAAGLLQPHTLGIGALPLWLAANALAVVLPRTPRIRVLLAGLAALALHPLLGMLLGRQPAGGLWDGDGTVSLVAYALMTPLLFVAGIWWWDIVVRLDDSRRTSGELAVANERLRFAADLHDIQGHHLQVIALKTELAGRLLAVDPEAARLQIDEAQALARTALEDTRALVNGYRAVSLASEAANAAGVLGAAGIECSVDVRADDLTPEQRTLLGLVIREATTNVLRHSEATTVDLALTRAGGRVTLTARNDGVTSAASPGGGSRTGGSGIDGLRRRFEAVGGTVRTDVDGGYFTVSAGVPDRVSAAVTPHGELDAGDHGRLHIPTAATGGTP